MSDGDGRLSWYKYSLRPEKNWALIQWRRVGCRRGPEWSAKANPPPPSSNPTKGRTPSTTYTAGTDRQRASAGPQAPGRRSSTASVPATSQGAGSSTKPLVTYSLLRSTGPWFLHLRALSPDGVMAQTDLQLFEVNQKTMAQWYIKTHRLQGVAVALQSSLRWPSPPDSSKYKIQN